MKLFFCFLFFVSSIVLAEKNSVEIPLEQWELMVGKIDNFNHRLPPEKLYCPVYRSIEGKIRKGLFKGTIKYQFDVFDSTSYIPIPVIDGSATIGNVTLNNKVTSLYRDDAMYTIGINKAGTYILSAQIFIGREVDRFERELSFLIPDGGPTRVSIEIPEKNIDPVLKNGALISTSEQGIGTQLEGYLDAGGRLELTWTRKLSHMAKSAVKSEMNIYTLCTVQEALITGKSLVKTVITEGETDRIDLILPENIEITDVSGNAVLQWRTDRKDENRCIVLLRHLVQDQVSMIVTYQLPVKAEQDITLAMPYPDTGVPLNAVVGILSSAGLNVQVKNTDSASQVELRDLPEELTNMTNKPFLFGFSYVNNPNIALSVSRHKDVLLTGTLIDNLQATTVIIKDGQEITKMKMRIRNNNRQYLKMEMPADAHITHSLIDGLPVRPAYVNEDGKNYLLFPLHQSESVQSSVIQYHAVLPGETLSDIALQYYSDAQMWEHILENNKEELYSADDLMQGQVLTIPPLNNLKVRESSFLIELAYKKPGKKPLGMSGKHQLQLPSVDIETVESVWHLYFPHDLNIISFKTNMTQLTSIRYTFFTRIRDFFRKAIFKRAWAGGGSSYSNILVKRKAIYKADFARRSREEAVMSNFPLVGNKYRFIRNLPGTETPLISFLYIPIWLSDSIKWSGFLIAFLLTLFLFRKKPDKSTIVTSIIVCLVLLVLAHYILGMHRRYLWGIDIALFITILKASLPGIRKNIKMFIEMPWSVKKIVTWTNVAVLCGMSIYIAIVLAFPMFFSSLLLVTLLLWHRFIRKSSVKIGGII